MRFIISLTWIVLVVSGIGTLNSCAAPTVALEHRTPLVKNQPYEGLQQNMDYQLTYRYVYSQGDASELDRIAFTGKLTPRRGLVTLTLRLHLLDPSGKVLVTQVLYAPGSGQGAGRASINRTIEVPSDAVTIAFSHFAQDKPIFY